MKRSRRQPEPGSSGRQSGPVCRSRLPLLETAALLVLLLAGIAAAVLFPQLANQSSLYGTPSVAGTPARLPSPAAAEALAARGLALLQPGAGPADEPALPGTGSAVTRGTGTAVLPGTGSAVTPGTSTAVTPGTSTAVTPGSGSAIRQPGAVWPALLSKDPDALGLYLQRLATAPAYLRQQKDDAAFAVDFWTLLQSAAAPAGDQAAPQAPQAPALASERSRIVWLAEALGASGFSVPGEWQAAGLLAPDRVSGTLGAMELKQGTPRSGAVVFGRRQLGGTLVRASADSAPAVASTAQLLFRTFLEVDGQVIATTGPAGLSTESASFMLPFDVRGRKPGLYHTEIFALASDGRGRHTDLGRLEVPMVQQLSEGEVMGLSLPSGMVPQPASADAAGPFRYASIDPVESSQGWRYVLTVAGPTGPVAAELFSLDGELIAACDNPGIRWEGLRALIAGDSSIPVADRVAYARIGPASGQPALQTPAGFTLVHSERAATLVSDPGQVFAVLGEQNDRLTVQDMAGTRRERPAAELDLVEFSGRLSELSLATDQGTVSFYPEFEAETETFGLYLPAGTGPLNIHANAREGSFASVTLSVQKAGEAAPLLLSCTGSAPTATAGPIAASAAAAAPTGPAAPGVPGAATAAASARFTPPPSESTLSVTVRNRDGVERTYRLHILQAPQHDGYHTVLEAFPASYRSPLYLLHVEQPSYRFVPHVVDIEFTAFTAAQTLRDRSLVDSAAVAESWVKPGSPVYDGRSWKAAAPGVVAYFSDPRNFLNVRDIFQFELLRYQADAHDRKGVETVIAGTFMAPGSDKNPDRTDYARLLLDAGQAADISPLFLASRIIQEMGRNGSSPLASGRLPGYEGVYNFYNIGATPNPAVPNGAQINAARYALYGQKPDEGIITPDEAVYRLPWKSPASAITGGAIWIAQRYTAIGQDTLYLQKFDLIAADGLYTHQYAQNIQMAWAEGRRTQSAYSSAGLLGQAFTFRIPVFRSLPQAPAPLPGAATRIR